jgi:UPF0716 protein FxsA
MPLFLILLVLLISIPVTELYVLLAIGSSIGALTTISLVILTAVLGAWLLRAQGLATIARAQAALQAGAVPATELVEGVILLLTGIMLLTPGFITDAMGFIALVPSVRRFLALAIARRVLMRHAHSRGRAQDGPQTIDGEYRVDDQERLP